jgi:hypothetical protein
MVSHLRYRRLLDAHLDDELDGVLTVRVGRHVDTCRRCGHDADLAMVIKSHLTLHRFLPPRRACGGRRGDD